MRKVGVRLNPSLHGIQGMMLDEETVAVHDYIVTKLNDYDLAYLHLTEPFTDISGNPWGIEEVAKRYRPLYDGTIIINRGFNKATASQVLNDGDADLVSFGFPLLPIRTLLNGLKQMHRSTMPTHQPFIHREKKGIPTIR